MASLDFKKCTKGAASGLKVHMEQKHREGLNHANRHIDRSLSHLNYAIGAKSYEDSYTRMLKRTEEVDKVKPPQRVKADRVICDMCYLVCPQEIESRSTEFFEKSYEFLKEYFGEENVHGMFVHLDEKHEYRDSRVKDENDNQAIKESLYHAHTMISCYTDVKGINGTAFNNKQMYRDIQKRFDNFVYQEFGVHYQTKDKAMKMSVESLKEASNKLADLEEEMEVLRRNNKVLRERNSELVREIKESMELIESSREKVELYKQIAENCIEVVVQEVEAPASLPNLQKARNALTRKEYYSAEEVEKFIVSAQKRSIEANKGIEDRNRLQNENKALKQIVRFLSKVDAFSEVMKLKKENEGLEEKVKAIEIEKSKLAVELSETHVKLGKEKKKNDEVEQEVKRLASGLDWWAKNFYPKALDKLFELGAAKSFANSFGEKVRKDMHADIQRLEEYQTVLEANAAKYQDNQNNQSGPYLGL